MPLTDPQFGRVSACQNPIHFPERIKKRIELARLPADVKPFSELRDRPEVTGFAAAKEAALAVGVGSASKPWLVLSGPPGTGKSALGGAALLERASHVELAPGCFVVLRDALDQLKASYAQAKSEGVEVYAGAAEQIFPRLLWRGLVVIDDLGALKVTEWAEEQIMAMLDMRWRERLATIITHDMDRRQMVARLNPRIIDRLEDHEMSVLIAMKGPSYRSGRQW